MARNRSSPLRQLRERALSTQKSLILCKLAERFHQNRMIEGMRGERKRKTWPNWIETIRVSWKTIASSAYKKRHFLPIIIKKKKKKHI
ncbi:unnamed protein product [Prunus armeniaca]